MEKKRVFYLDFIRSLATLLIVLTHYNAIFIYDIYRPDASAGPIWISNVYIGNIGVSLFLIISGLVLYQRYGNEEHVTWGECYRKRF